LPRSYRPATQIRRMYIAARDKAAPLYICRVVFLLLRQRRGAGLGKLQCARGQSKYFATSPAHTQRAVISANRSKGYSVKTTSFSRSGYSRARHLYILFPVPNRHAEFLMFLRSSPPFFSRVLPDFRLLLGAKLCTFRLASAVARWAPSFGRWCATSTTSTCFITRP
jgi:hypothetical protein